MKLIKPADEYLEKAGLLSADEIERLLARMRGKLSRRLDDKVDRDRGCGHTA